MLCFIAELRVPNFKAKKYQWEDFKADSEGKRNKERLRREVKEKFMVRGGE
jgi:hypothetical protein